MCSTRSQIASRVRGTPARTCRGRSGRRPSRGARGTAERATPGHLPVSAAYRMPARLITSASRSSSSPYSGSGGRGPSRVASTTYPISLTAPAWVTSTASGLSRPWATPWAWPAAIASATSRASQAARAGGRVPCWSIRSRETPSPHSLTTQVMPSASSQSSTRSRCGSLTVAETRAPSSSAAERSSSLATAWMATLRARIVSVARQKRAPSRLGEEVVEPVAPREDGPGSDRAGHRGSPRSRDEASDFVG